jgi:hypothetical protein
VGIAQASRADAEDHRAMPREERGEGEVGGIAFAGGEPFEKLTVRKVTDCPQIKEGAKVSGGRLLPDRHVRCPAPGGMVDLSENDKAASGLDGSNFRQDS